MTSRSNEYSTHLRVSSCVNACFVTASVVERSAIFCSTPFSPCMLMRNCSLARESHSATAKEEGFILGVSCPLSICHSSPRVSCNCWTVQPATLFASAKDSIGSVSMTGTALPPTSCHVPAWLPFIRFTTSVPSLLLKYVVPQSPQVVAVIVRLLLLLLPHASAEPLEESTQNHILHAVKSPFALALYTRWNVQPPSPPHPMKLPAYEVLVGPLVVTLPSKRTSVIYTSAAPACPKTPAAWVDVEAVTSVDTHTRSMVIVGVPTLQPIRPAECMPPLTVPVTCRFLIVASPT